MDFERKYLDAGEIVNTHGVRGEIKIVPWADSADFLRGFRTFYIDGAAYRVLRSSVHKGCLLAALEGVSDMDAASALKGKIVQIARAEARLPAGSYFLSDLLGARVVTEDGEAVGTLEDIIENPTAARLRRARGDGAPDPGRAGVYPRGGPGGRGRHRAPIEGM
jgi:16S rRNA processing protein RimM